MPDAIILNCCERHVRSTPRKGMPIEHNTKLAMVMHVSVMHDEEEEQEERRKDEQI